MAVSAREYLNGALAKPLGCEEANNWLLEGYRRRMARLCEAFGQTVPTVIEPCHQHILQLRAAGLAPDFAQDRRGGRYERWVTVSDTDWRNPGIRRVIFGCEKASDPELQPTRRQKVEYCNRANRWHCEGVALHAWSRHVARAGRALAMYIDQTRERPRSYKDFERASACLDSCGTVMLSSSGAHEQVDGVNAKWLFCDSARHYDLACAIDERHEALVAADDIEVCVVTSYPDDFGVRARHIGREDNDGVFYRMVGVKDDLAIVLVPRGAHRFFPVP